MSVIYNQSGIAYNQAGTTYGGDVIVGLPLPYASTVTATANRSGITATQNASTFTATIDATTLH